MKYPKLKLTFTSLIFCLSGSFVILLLMSQTAFGQNPKQKVLLAGGYYEGIQFGYDRTAASGKFRWQVGLGFEKFLVKSQTIWSFSFNAGTPVFRKKQDSGGNYYWFMMGKLIFWQMNDPFYECNVIESCHLPQPVCFRTACIDRRFGALFSVRSTFQAKNKPGSRMALFCTSEPSFVLLLLI
ncbi:MAG TPA: hypothetical protein PLK63_15085 [Catalimonadaceae bacterium]|nr:hypothetical protein [Catalimonadaceae bacterium]